MSKFTYEEGEVFVNTKHYRVRYNPRPCKECGEIMPFGESELCEDCREDKLYKSDKTSKLKGNFSDD